MGIQTASIHHGDGTLASRVGGIVGHCQIADIGTWQYDDQTHYVKTHHRAKNHRSGEAAIQVVRDGRDAMVSYAHYRLTIEKHKERFRDMLTSLITDSRHNWSSHAFSWQGNVPYPVTIIRYEDLIQSPLEATIQAMDSLGLPYELTGKSMPEFEHLHNYWPEFFRKGQSGSWRTEMTKRQHELFWTHHGAAMELLEYT